MTFLIAGTWTRGATQRAPRTRSAGVLRIKRVDERESAPLERVGEVHHRAPALPHSRTPPLSFRESEILTLQPTRCGARSDAHSRPKAPRVVADFPAAAFPRIRVTRLSAELLLYRRRAFCEITVRRGRCERTRVARGTRDTIPRGGARENGQFPRCSTS